MAAKAIEMQQTTQKTTESTPIVKGGKVNRSWLSGIGYNPNEPYIDYQSLKVKGNEGTVNVDDATVFLKKSEKDGCYDCAVFGYIGGGHEFRGEFKGIRKDQIVPRQKE